jgi:hypothetical protein
MLKLKSILLVSLSVLAPLAATGFGQSHPPSHQLAHANRIVSAAATSDCQSTFTSGSGVNFLEFCVTVNGNITEFQSPQGIEHIREGGFAEGYGICDFSNLTRYTDFADLGDSGNWLDPVRTQPHGANTFPLKIVRNTSDGIFTLTQTFVQNPGERIVKITMTIKNNTAVARDFAMVRYADIDANNADFTTLFTNTFDFDREAAWGYNPGFNDFGLMLATVPVPETFGEFAVVQSTSDAIDPCAPVDQLASTPFVGDGSVAIDWNGTLGPRKSATFTGEYRRF